MRARSAAVGDAPPAERRAARDAVLASALRSLKTALRFRAHTPQDVEAEVAMPCPHVFRGLLLATLVVATPSARSSDDCEVPTASWQPRSAVNEWARRNGWQIDRLKIDDGCYEIRGRDAEGRRVKAKLDPATLEIVRIRHARDEPERERDRERERQRAPASPADAGRG